MVAVYAEPSMEVGSRTFPHRSLSSRTFLPVPNHPRLSTHDWLPQGVKGSRALAIRSFLLKGFCWSGDSYLVFCGRNIVLVRSAGRGVLQPDILC